MLTTKNITINGNQITCSELNVGQIDMIIGAVDPNGPMQCCYNLMGYDLTPEFVATSSLITPDEQGKLDVDELDQLVGAVMEVNARFLSRIKAKAAKADQVSSGTSAS